VSLVTIFFTLVAVLLPLWTPWFTWKHFEELGFSQFEGQYGALYEGIDHENKIGLAF